MTEQTWPDWFTEQIEKIVDGRQPQVQSNAPDDLRLDLELAVSLAHLDLSSESLIRSSLRNRLSREDIRNTAHPVNRLDTIRQPGLWMRLTLMVMILLASLSLTNSPVLAAFGRMLGYGYFSQTGFIRLDRTLLLPGPVLLAGPNGFQINLVVADLESTRIWTLGSMSQLDGLTLGNGIRFVPNRSEPLADGSIVWYFDPLPAGQSHFYLTLKGGQQIPLGLVPASEVGLSPTAVTLPTRTPESSSGQPCLAGAADQRPCIQAAEIDDQGLHLLVRSPSGIGVSAPNLWDWSLSLNAPGEAPILVKSILPGEDPGEYSLLFAPFPIQDGNVTLSARSSAFGNLNAVTFTLPKAQPSFSPTPRVIQTPSGQILPAHTPSKN